MNALDALWYAALDLHNDAVNMRVACPAEAFEQRCKLDLAANIRREVRKLGLDIVEPRIATQAPQRRAA